MITVADKQQIVEVLRSWAAGIDAGKADTIIGEGVHALCMRIPESKLIFTIRRED